MSQPPKDQVPPNALIFVLITVFIDVMGLGIIIPVVPSLIQELTDTNVSNAAGYNQWLTFTYAFALFVCSPIMGSISDKVGRRPVLLISILGLGFDYLMMALAPTITLLFVGRLIAGIFGANFATANAYIIDISSKENRAKNLGFIGAAFGLGFIIGPVIGGLLGELGTRAPLYFAAALSLANFVYGYFVLPESLSAQNRRSINLKRANPLGAFAHLFKNRAVFAIAMAAFAFMLANAIYPSIWPFYTKELFAYEEWQIGLSLGVFGVFYATVQGGLIGPVIKRIGEYNAFLMGLSFEIIAMLGLGFINKEWMLYVMLFIGALGGFVLVAANAMMANRTADDSQGELQGLVNGLSSITLFLTPLLITPPFQYFTQEDASPYLPGAPFLAGVVFLVISLAIFLIFVRNEDDNGATATSKASHKKR